ncbi:MAG: hypothetical protein ABI180_16695 [Microcoleus sp.]
MLHDSSFFGKEFALAGDRTCFLAGSWDAAIARECLICGIL